MILDRFKIQNKVAVITGGTRGIGLAIAHALGEAGAKLVVTSRTDQHGGLKSLEQAGYDATYFQVANENNQLNDKQINQYIKK